MSKKIAMYVCKYRKTLDNNDLKRVAGKRFSLKQCFAAGDHSNRLRKNSSAHCHLRISQNFSDLCAKCAAQLRIRAFLSTLSGKTPRENSFGVWWFLISFLIVYDYPPKGRWIVVDIYRDGKRRGIYPPLFTDPEGDSCFRIYQIRWRDSCFRIYQIRWIKKRRFINGHNFFFWTFVKRRAIFLSVRKTVSIQGYSKLREPIKTRENCCPLFGKY